LVGSLVLFAKGNYLSFGNLYGLLADIKGLRQCSLVPAQPQPQMTNAADEKTISGNLQDIASAAMVVSVVDEAPRPASPNA
jgi:hypothetical protein